MATIFTFFQGHWLATCVIGFTILSKFLAFLADAFKTAGVNLPGWIGKISDVLGSVLHFLNGSTTAIEKPTVVEKPAV